MIYIMKSKLIIFLLMLLCGQSYAQTNGDKYLKLLLRNGIDSYFQLKEHPCITFFDDSIRIVTEELYAVAKRADIKTMTFTAESAENIINSEVAPGKYYRIKGISGRYIDASDICDNDRISMKNDEACSLAGSIFYLDGNRLLNYATGTYLDAGAGLTAVGSDDGKWEIAVSPHFSNRFTFKDEEGYLLCDNAGESLDVSVGQRTFNQLFTLEEITYIPVTITSIGYATLFAPVAVELPQGVKAHTVTIHGEWAILSEGFSVVPAFTGVILSAKEGEYNLTITSTDNDVQSLLTGTIANSFVSTEAYVLSAPDNKVGLYKAVLNKNEGKAFMNQGHKAYLPAVRLEPTQQSSVGYRFDNGNITEITEPIENEEMVIYDLKGVRINKIVTPGYYIINGKKVQVLKCN